MCGITAIFCYRQPNIPVNPEELLRMRDSMLKRGPDGAGLWMSPDGRVGLAHRRLAIIDLSEKGAQPMATADGRLRIVFNGEIYNYRDLRDQLQALGHVFTSDSDTEVLLYAYREYGPSMAETLQGMFAFAIWDEEKKGLFLARDHFGIKPLYYFDDGKTFRAASQVKALLAGRGFDPVSEPAGHVGFYLWGSVPEPYTLYRNLFSLPAGHSLWVDACGAREAHKFFDIAEELVTGVEIENAPPVAEVLSYALRESVRQHLIADVPVGVFLSSGLDSATLTGLAAEEAAAPLQAITLGFKEYENTPADEVPLAEWTAAYYGCRHHTGRIQREDFEENLAAILQDMDQPSIDGVNTWFVAREASRAGLKVVISGLGGDELLGGYPSFGGIPRLVSRLGPLAWLPAGFGKTFRVLSAPLIKRFTSPKYASLFEYGGTAGGAYFLRRALFMPWELAEFLDADLVRNGWDRLQPILQLDRWVRPVQSPHASVAAMEMAWYMRNMLLRDSDWAGMAHSLEIRLPLVHIALFRALAPYLAGGSPPEKHNLAQASKRRLPDAIIHRPKTGFSIPVREWVKTRDGAYNRRGLRGWALRLMQP